MTWIVILASGLVVIVFGKLLWPILKPPAPHESLTMQQHPELLARIQVPSNPPSGLEGTYISRVVQRSGTMLKAGREAKGPMKTVPVVPSPVTESITPLVENTPLSTLAANTLVNTPVTKFSELVTHNPNQYTKMMIQLLYDLHNMQSKEKGSFSRTRAMDQQLASATEWDHFIGPVQPGTKQPGLFRQLGLIEELSQGMRFRYGLDETTRRLCLWYLDTHGDIPAVDNEIKLFYYAAWAQYHGLAEEEEILEEDDDLSLDE